jgi:hypothetical protein
MDVLLDCYVPRGVLGGLHDWQASAEEMKACTYTKVKVDGYGTDWHTSCGRDMRYESPIEVGFSFAPDPTEVGTYCTHCGGKIVLNEGKDK